VGQVAGTTPDQPATPDWTNPGRPEVGAGPAQPPAEIPPLQGALPYAGFWRRLGAFAIDLFFVLLGSLVVSVLIAVLLAIALISTSGSAPTSDTTVQLASLLILLVLAWLYFAGLESSGWQGTLGKRMTGLLVTDMAGRRLSFGRSSARYFAKILSAIPILIGYFLAAFTPQKQALHDMIAGTLVVRKRGTRTAAVPLAQGGHPEQTAIGSEAQRA
jgi:uncharacterized RDD family membrane protein YckC